MDIAPADTGVLNFAQHIVRCEGIIAKFGHCDFFESYTPVGVLYDCLHCVHVLPLIQASRVYHVPCGSSPGVIQCLVDVPILRGKIQIPLGHGLRIERIALLDRMDAGFSRKLTLVVAPAGYGKTSLLAQWLARADQPASWYTVDERDNQLPRFMTYLAASLESMSPALPRQVEHLLGSPRLLPPEMLVERIVASVEADVPRNENGPTHVLVLDDYQLIVNEDIHAAVRALLRDLPLGLRVVISSRSDPPIQIPALRAKDELIEIRQNQLRFSLAEASRFFASTQSEEIDEADMADICDKTEGWAAGLHFAALAISQSDRVAEMESGGGLSYLLRNFSGRHHFILDYLFDEVLAAQPPQVRLFLELSSLFERFSAPLCDAVLVPMIEQIAGGGSITPSAEVIDRLLTENLFISRLVPEEGWFRYHRLFRDLLRDGLRVAHAECIPEFHERAGRWFLASGMFEEGMEHLFESERADAVAATLETALATFTSWTSVNLHTVIGWIDRLPANVLDDHAMLCLYASRILFVAGDPRRSALLLERFEEYEDGQVRTTALSDLASYAAVNGDVRKSFAILDSLPVSDSGQSVEFLTKVQTIRGMGFLRIGDLDRAGLVFGEALTLSAKSPHSVIGYTVQCNLAEVLYQQGRLHDSFATCEAVIRNRNQDGATSATAGIALLLRARIEYEWNQPERALDTLKAGMDASAAKGTTDSFGMGRVLLCRVLFALGRGEEITETLREVEWIVKSYGIERLMSHFEASAVQIRMQAGDSSAGIRWYEDYRYREPVEYTTDIEALTCSRIEILLEDYTGAISRLERLSEEAATHLRMGTLLGALTLRAIACFKNRDKAEAFALLNRAIEGARQEHYVRLFVDEGPMVFELIRQARSQSAVWEYAVPILHAFEPAVMLRESAEYTPLSKREIDVLALIAEHLSNEAIGAQLFISRPTVKTHVRHIFEKLDVSNRSDAVAVATELQIIP
jgi:LuxR family transcriptional regulator, maltose regulon positive regulatory protein